MELKPVGATTVEPQTYFLWYTYTDTSLEITVLDNDLYMIQACKSYRLLKQDKQAWRENWSRNLVELNTWMAETFPSFQISLDYVNEVTPKITGVGRDAQQLAGQVAELTERRKQLEHDVSRMETVIEHGLDDLSQVIEVKYGEKNQELEQVDAELQHIQQTVREKHEELGVWQNNGVSAAYLFSFGTDPEIVDSSELPRAVDDHLQDAYDLHRRKIKQVLQGSKFKLAVEELDQPRVFNRLEHTMLLNPKVLQNLVNENPDLATPLKQVFDSNTAQYQAYGLTDIETSQRTVEKRNVTPTRAVQSLLKGLEDGETTHHPDLPTPMQQRPFFGVIPGTTQAVGLDPADSGSHGINHWYILGGTGAGKTYTRRVLLENSISLGYDNLVVVPSDDDFTALGLDLPHPDNSRGLCLNAEHYILGDERFPSLPTDLTDLFRGTNTVSLHGLTQQQKERTLTDILIEAARLSGLTKPLFLYLEEVHKYRTPEALDAIREIAREGRKFGVHLVISTQNPTDFGGSEYKVIRDQLNHVFMKGRFTQYAGRFLEDGRDVKDLGQGQVLMGDWDFGETRLSVRLPFTTPDVKLIERHGVRDKLVARYSQSAHFSESATKSTSKEVDAANASKDSDVSVRSEPNLTSDQEDLLEFIHQYIIEHDERPSHSKIWRGDGCRFGQSKSRKLLDQLLERELIRSESVKRYGQEFDVYRPEVDR